VKRLGAPVKLYEKVFGEKWKAHPNFRGTRLRSIERENGEIADVPDGIVFLILSALSVFVKSPGLIRRRYDTIPRRKFEWVFRPVEKFDEQELIDAAAQVYMEIADHNPQTMGKSKACYSALQTDHRDLRAARGGSLTLKPLAAP
jgi:hypothetical protein